MLLLFFKQFEFVIFEPFLLLCSTAQICTKIISHKIIPSFLVSFVQSDLISTSSAERLNLCWLRCWSDGRWMLQAAYEILPKKHFYNEKFNTIEPLPAAHASTHEYVERSLDFKNISHNFSCFICPGLSSRPFKRSIGRVRGTCAISNFKVG